MKSIPLILCGIFLIHFHSIGQVCTPRSNYEISLDTGTTILVQSASPATISPNNEEIFAVRYHPSHPSTNMWKHIVEMYDVADYFKKHATADGISKLRISPLIYPEDDAPNTNVFYYYSINEGAVITDWQLQYQSWFRDEKE